MGVEQESADITNNLNISNFVNYDEDTKIWKSTKDFDKDIRGKTIGEIFLKRMRSSDFGKRKVLETHHDIAVVNTEEDIYRESVTVAINLNELGIKKGDVILLFSGNNASITPLVMGGYITGAAVNIFKTENEEDIDYSLQLLDPTLIIYEEVFKSIIMAALQRIKLLKLKHFVSIDTNEDSSTKHLNIKSSLLKKVSPLEIEQFKCPDLGDPAKLVAALVLTSGSTGKPKAVALNHTRLLHGISVLWLDLRWPELMPNTESVMLFLSNIYWISHTSSVLHSVLLGIPRICLNEWPPTGSYCRDIVRQHRVTHLFGIPEYYNDILQSVEPSDQSTLASLQLVLLVSDNTSDKTIELSKRLAVNCRVWRSFGMTELATGIVSDSKVNGGLLVPGVEIKILDDNGNTVGPLQRGQLCVRVPAPFHYLKVDRSKTFLPDDFFNTGDYVFVDKNGLLNVLSRYCNLVKTKDSIIVPTEIVSEVNQLEGVLTSSLVPYRLDAASYDLAVLFIVLKKIESGANRDRIKANIENSINSKLLSKIRLENIYFIEKLPQLFGGKTDQEALRKLAKEGTLRSNH